MAPVNFWSILAATVASIAIGSLWYGPMLFGNIFMEAMGMKEWSEEKKAKMKKNMVWSYVGQTVASLVMFFFLAGFIVGFAKTTAVGGLFVGFTVWLGFILPLTFGNLMWGGKKSLFWLMSGNMLITLLVAGAIIGAMN